MRRGSRRYLLCVGVLAVTCSSLAVGSAAIAADNMYKTANANWNCWDGTMSDGLFCQTDNSAMSVWMQGSVSSSRKTTIRNMLHNQYSPTALAVSYPSSPSYSGGSETDIIYQVSTSGFSGTTIGQTWCNDAVTSTKCDQEYVRFRGTIQFDSELTCHETGHAVGLTHGVDASPKESNTASELGCMETPDSSNRPGLGSHNKSEINATY
jgi:hypothetical protein